MLSLENIKENNNVFQFWTGLPSYGIFTALFDYLEPRAKTLQYWKGRASVIRRPFSTRFTTKPGRERKLSLMEELFLTLVRLRVGLLMADLAARFGIMPSTASSIFKTWIHFLHIELKELCCLPDVDKMKTDTAPAFSEFIDVHLVMDCTELSRKIRPISPTESKLSPVTNTIRLLNS